MAQQHVTPGKTRCTVRYENYGAGGHRWHVAVEGRKTGPSTFYLWIDRETPEGFVAASDATMRAVLRAVDGELTRDTEGKAEGYGSMLDPAYFEEE